MESVYVIRIKNRMDLLKYIYAFLISPRINKKECTFVNPKSDKTARSVVTFVDRCLPPWKKFKTDKIATTSPVCICIGSLDTQDTKRVGFDYINNCIYVKVYGNFEDEAKVAFQDVYFKYRELSN